ncbi:ribonuclease III [Ascobolus immersus RN42]|uniref:Large ribosomal subunit protein mL44 n=1 Tax=Ascobolus immersus RN42 TaxID=1160509 RepID=A0A3N4I7N0_ASCIM|nr:ribonuclease III [Ascobolus immersus RN42]
MICLDQSVVTSPENLHLLGKNRPSSGILLLSSLSALTLHAHAVMPKMVRPMMAYQPPVGDQTCFGYLVVTKVRDWSAALNIKIRIGAVGENEWCLFLVLMGAGPAPISPCRQPLTSTRLAALHARLGLSKSKFPLETLAKCLIDRTMDHNPAVNNSALSNLGNNLIGYWTSEYLLTKYPRLPRAILGQSVSSFAGNKVLHILGREWGIDHAFMPKAEADAGLLQFGRVRPGEENWMLNAVNKRPVNRLKLEAQGKERQPLEEEMGLTTEEVEIADPSDKKGLKKIVVGMPLELAYANAVKAVFGAIYLHEGQKATYEFFKAHILSRHFDLEKVFDFFTPTRTLSRIAAREGFEPPIARLLSESGRNTRHPVFNVGVFSGDELLGEGAGASLNEARIRAAVNALKAWYLYSPPASIRGDLPSKTERDPSAEFRGGFLDKGDVVI